MPAAAGLTAQSSVLQQLHSMLSVTQQAQQALQLAACPLLAATTAEGLRGGWLSNSQVAASLAQLLSLLGPLGLLGAALGAAPASVPGPSPQASDGRVVGAAAAALGALLPSLVNQGYAPDAQHAPETVLQVGGAASRRVLLL